MPNDSTKPHSPLRTKRQIGCSFFALTRRGRAVGRTHHFQTTGLLASSEVVRASRHENADGCLIEEQWHHSDGLF